MGSAWCQTALMRWKKQRSLILQLGLARSKSFSGKRLGRKKTDVPIDEGNVARPGVVVDLVALVVEGEASSFESVIFRTVRPPIRGKSHDD
jgi:hypothetical protein